MRSASTPSALLRDPARLVDIDGFQALIARRAAREPLALIVGRREFWSLDFAVSPAALVPRPDSETLIEAAVATFVGRTPPCRVLDLGTGTGCLLLAALSEFPAAFGVGVDCSFAAASLAACNAAMLGLADRAAIVCADWTDALGGCFDLILCNPPYIAASHLDGLMPEVACHEPRTALDGGADGYSAYRRLIPGLPRLLAHERGRRAGTRRRPGGHRRRIGARRRVLHRCAPRSVGDRTRPGAASGRGHEKTVWQSDGGSLAWRSAGPAEWRLTSGSPAESISVDFSER